MAPSSSCGNGAIPSTTRRATRSACRRDECELALLFIDLDRFKNVNDALGHPAAEDRFGLENDLRGALDRGELQLYFQPQVRPKDGHLMGAEALLRWHHFQQGMISPLRFIPLAEETGLIIPIGEWVLTEATAAMQRWIAAGLSLGRIAVNIAGPQIHRGDLVSVLRRALDTSGLDPARLELEITESFIMHRPEDSLKTLVDLRETGICLSIDDFGTGFSSLAYLKRPRLWGHRRGRGERAPAGIPAAHRLR